MSASAGHTDAGSRYGQLNQDKFFVVEKTITLVKGEAKQDDNDNDNAQKKESEYGAWGVFDGHGLLGEYASRIASSTMQLNLEMSFGEDPECLREEVVSCFSTSHQNIIQSYNIAPLRYKFGDVATFVLSLASPDSEDIIYVNEEDPEDFRPLEFGTTAVIVFRKDNEYIIANAGNSHAVVGRVSSSATLLPPERLTTEHSIRNPEELRRVKEGIIDDANQEGELIDVTIEDTSVPRAGLTIVEGGYLVCEGMKLRATRALGHSMVTYSPSIRYYTVQPDDFVIVVASDGVWDNLPDEKVTEIALQHRASGPLVAAKSIVDAALEASLFPHYKDNTTAIVIFL